MMYAIEIIGGARKRYAIKHILNNGTICPTDGKAYRTEEAARAAADILGVEIAAVGDLWQLLKLAEG